MYHVSFSCKIFMLIFYKLSHWRCRSVFCIFPYTSLFCNVYLLQYKGNGEEKKENFRAKKIYLCFKFTSQSQPINVTTRFRLSSYSYGRSDWQWSERVFVRCVCVCVYTNIPQYAIYEIWRHQGFCLHLTGKQLWSFCA